MMFNSPMWITPLPPPLTALGKGSHGSVLSENYQPNRLSSGRKSTLPTDEASMLRHYTLADDDLDLIHARRRPHNRFGFALQLCALRYPGRLLTPGEVMRKMPRPR
jgi:hypothetical protein